MTEVPQNTNTIDDLSSLEEALPVPTDEINQLTTLQEALTVATEETKTLNDKYLRLAAEFENYKRLSQRDQRDQMQFGNERVLKELLPVVDNLERAILASQEGGDSSVLIQGVDLTLKQLTSALTRFHVTALVTIDQPFDPTKHQAVTSVPSKIVPEQHIVNEFQRGYRLHERILRAAMVSVSTGPPEDESNKNETSRSS